MLDKLKKICSWYAYHSIALVFSVAFAGSGIYMLWLEVRRSAAYETVNAFTVESWNAVMANSPHRQATVWEMVVMVAVLILSTAVVVSPMLAIWVFLIRLDSRKSQNAQVERDGEANHDRVCDEAIEEIGIRINKNIPLRRSPVYCVKERRRSGMFPLTDDVQKRPILNTSRFACDTPTWWGPKPAYKPSSRTPYLPERN